jgi:hypothetical protein
MAAILWVSYARPYVGEEFSSVAASAAWRFVFLAGLVALLWFWPLWRPRGIPHLAQMGILLMLWGDLITHSPRQNPTIDSTAFAPGAVLQYYKSHGQLAQAPSLGQGRIMLSPMAELAMYHRMVPDFYQDFMGQRLSMWGNLSMLDHLPKVNGASTLVTREEFQIEQLLYGGTTNDLPNVAEFLGARYITAPGELLKWSLRTNPMPLITAGQQPVFTRNADDTLARLRDPDFNPRQEVFLSEDARPLVAITNRTDARVLNMEFREQAVNALVEARQPSLVVIAQTWYPAWKAYVDGHETPLFHANLAFQGLQVPAGTHTIRLEYHDRAFRLGSIITIATGIFCAGMWWRRYRQKV